MYLHIDLIAFNDALPSYLGFYSSEYKKTGAALMFYISELAGFIGTVFE